MEKYQVDKIGVRDLDSKYLHKKHNLAFDIVIGELAFSVIPDCQKVMRTAASLLNKEGCLDLSKPKLTIKSTYSQTYSHYSLFN